MLKCRSCAAGRAQPCYDPLPYDGVGGVFISETTPDCMIKNPGRRMIIKLSIIDVTSGLMSSTLSAPFDVVTGNCKRLKVILHPNGVIVGQPFRRPPIVEMQDDGSNTIPWVRNTISVSLPTANDATAILSGCREANGDTPNTNVDGTATFFGCVINCRAMNSYSCLGQDLFRLQFTMTSCDGNAAINTDYTDHNSNKAY